MKNQSQLELSEKTIDLLQSLDATFSQINKVLKDLNSKIIKLDKNNDQNIIKMDPWFKFFGIGKIFDAKEQNDNRITDSDESFSRNANSSIEEIKNNKKSLCETSSENDLNLPQLKLRNLYNSESFCNSTAQSPRMNRPPEFQTENIENISVPYDPYTQKMIDLVKSKQCISLDAIYHSFEEIQTDRVDEILQSLIQKRFLGCRDGAFYIR